MDGMIQKRGKVFKQETPLKSYGKENNIKSILSLPNAASGGWDEFFATTNGKEEEEAGIVFSFGYLIPSSVIGTFRRGIINVHPSLLPMYRGASPIHYALMKGDEETGVSIIDVHPVKFDVGDIIAQKALKIEKQDTFSSLSLRLVDLASEMLLEMLPRYVHHCLKRKN